MSIPTQVLQAGWCAGLLVCVATAATAQSAGSDFFEARVRPVLAKNCYSCHTNSELGGLRLDSGERVLKGGKSGPAVKPGSAKESLLIQAVEQTHERLKMPPTSKLTPEEIASLRQWVDDGAIWPRDAALVAKPVITPERRAFWSFQPVRQVPLPPVKNQKWAKTAIDRFLLARLEAEGMQPARPADRRTLIRRVTFDLTGLPPTPEEVDEFVSDRSANAYEKLVDRLLASPQYGERWARHWLDLARYSDGMQAAREDTPYANAFRYRDWVIDAFNKDMPYDVFVKAQIAADKMPEASRETLLAGLGFQTLGENDNDRVDVNTRVFLGLTVGCAQCHDHKFDPIPTKDYYSLLGVFRNSKPEEYPLVKPEVADAYKKARKAADDKKEELKLFQDKLGPQVVDILIAQTEQYVVAAWRLMADPSRKAAALAAENDLDTETLERWVRYLKLTERDHKFFACWDDLMRKSGGAAKASEGEVKAVARQMQTAAHDIVTEKKAMDDRNYVTLGGREGMKNTAKVIKTLVDALPIEKFYFWRDLASNPYKVEDLKFAGGVYYYTSKDVERFLSPPWKKYLATLREESAALEKAVPEPYPYWHVWKDVPKPVNMKIAIRGDMQNPGEEAPRRFLQILSAGEPSPFTSGSGRLDLAEAIASPKNPLTARVMVNRIWKHHFGEGIVRSASNFGQLGDRPTHPELLDYLASRFIDSGWSVKAMHREMLLSAAYQMTSDETNSVKDPENKLLSHANVRERMDAESLRDALLSVAGTLDAKPGGAPKPLDDQFVRRSIYATVSRTSTDRTMTVFDFPDPSTTSEQRLTTVGPMQRLFFMNSGFVTQQSKSLAARLAKEAADDRKRIARAYEILYARPVTEEEIKLGLAFVQGKPEKWPQYTQVLLGAAEFSAIQ
jgi:hypothetical protein